MQGKDLQILLNKYGLTQQYLADYFGITRQYVNYWCSRNKPISKAWSIIFKQFFEEVNAKILDNKLSKIYTDGDTESET